jgi:hypothetical protein
VRRLLQPLQSPGSPFAVQVNSRVTRDRWYDFLNIFAKKI